MIKIIADNKIPFLQGILEPFAEMTYMPGIQTQATHTKDTDALITRTRTKCTAQILHNSKVKMIATATIGFDHIDIDYCQNNNIEWTNSPGCNSGSVKQYIASILATLSIKKNLCLKNKTLGIIGVGNVGTKIKDLAKGLGITVLLNDPPREKKEGSSEFVDIETIQKNADIITFHVPLIREGSNKTMHLANLKFFNNCKKEVIIINSSRGEVINNDDLYKALENNIIEDAILDVWENEPDISLKLMNKLLMATPHIAGYSVDGKANGTAMSVQAVSKHFDLPLKDWYPSSLPNPENPIIHINAQDLSLQDVCTKAILHTYQVMDDDKQLRKSPNNFEKLRGSYPNRREFCAYKISISNGSEYFVKGLNKIGFEHVELI